MSKRLLIVLFAAGLSTATAAQAQSRYGAEREYRGGHVHGHDLYVVKYHLDHSQKRHASSHREAHQLVNVLERLGAHAHIDGSHVVHYHMDGSSRRSFESHHQAHQFEAWLRSFGFHVRVIEE